MPILRETAVAQLAGTADDQALNEVLEEVLATLHQTEAVIQQDAGGFSTIVLIGPDEEHFI